MLFQVVKYIQEIKITCRISLGKDGVSKTDEFSEKFQTAFDPPSFSENHIADFATKVRDFAIKMCDFVIKCVIL